ncbi:MAG TPA: DUF4270 family protein [Sphingobacteriaceae bacterium]|nr:DUF4270 family protein [Sphingobacteriaceae bacterium]
MKYGYKDLLTLLISLFIFAGCTNPTGIGLEVAPEDQIEPMFTDTVSLLTYTLEDDSMQSSSSNQTVFGRLEDPIFGTMNVGLALDIAPAANVKGIRADAEIDSVILVLPYGQNFYGDSLSSTYHLTVRQLAEPFIMNAYATKQWDVEDEVIGSRTLNRYAYKSTDSLSISRHVDGKDTVVRVGPQLRIPLAKDFFRNMLNESVDSLTLVQNPMFRNRIKGLYLSVDSNASTGIGSLMSFMPVEGLSGVELIYRQSNGKTGEDAGIDTIRTLLPIAAVNYSSGGGFMGMSSSIDRQYTPEITELLNGSGLSPEQVYLQAPAGLRGKIVFPEIDQLKGRNLLINKAELVLWVDQTAMEGPFTQAAPRLTLYREDIAGRRQNIPDGSEINPNTGMPLDMRSLNYLNFGGWYQPSPQRYVFYVTSYIQDVLQGKINGNELYISPAAESDPFVPIYPSISSGGRVVLGGHANENYRMKLNLYYTEVENPS